MMTKRQWMEDKKARFWRRVRELADADPALLESFKKDMHRKRRVRL